MINKGRSFLTRLKSYDVASIKSTSIYISYSKYNDMIISRSLHEVEHI